MISRQDRRALSILALFLSLFLYYFLMYSPIKKAIEEKKYALSIQYIQHQWLSQIKPPDLPIYSSPTPSLSIEEIMEKLSHQLKTSEFKAFSFHLEQSTPGQLTISFEKVPYLSFLQWLYSASQTEKVQIQRLNIHPLKKAGLVQLQMTILINTSRQR